MGLKDNLNEDNITLTLAPEDVQFLAHINAYTQRMLDDMQQHLAAAYLNNVIVTKHGLDAQKNYRFNFDPAKESDNLIVTEISEE